MELTHPNIAIQARHPRLKSTESPLKRIFKNDPAVLVQILLSAPVFIAGAILHLNAIQWILVTMVTLLFLVAGVFRAAALLQAKQDSEMTPFHVSRVQTMGNALVTLTAGISLITYLLVFVPIINQLA